MKLRAILFFGSTLGLAASAGAAQADTKRPRLQLPANFCRPGSEILDATKSCLDNRVFVDEADDCLERLQAEVDKATSGLKAAFSKDAVQKQTGKFASSQQDYSAASLTLTDLLALTEQVMDEVDSYADFVNLPEDIGNDEVTGGDEEGYAEKHPCYSETRDSLDSIQDDLEQVKADLEKAKTTADAAAATSSARKGGLDVQAGSQGNAPVTGGKASTGAGKVGSGKSTNGTSDITGVSQEKEKQKKGNGQ